MLSGNLAQTEASLNTINIVHSLSYQHPLQITIHFLFHIPYNHASCLLSLLETVTVYHNLNVLYNFFLVVCSQTVALVLTVFFSPIVKSLSGLVMNC